MTNLDTYDPTAPAEPPRGHALIPRQITSDRLPTTPVAAPSWLSTFQQPLPVADRVSLAASAVLSPEFARVPIPEGARWLAHLTPLLAAGALDAAGLWAANDRYHVAFAFVPGCLGILGLLGATVALVAAAWPSRNTGGRNTAGRNGDRNRNRNVGGDRTEAAKAAAKIAGGGGVALLSLGAMMGNGVSGTGCTGAVAEVIGAFVAWAGWIGWRRTRNQEVVVQLAQALGGAKQPPAPPAFTPPPGYGQPIAAAAANPHEARLLAALDSMGYPGTAAGPPRALGNGAWTIEAALPPGRGVSPQQLLGQTDVLASSLPARRVEIASLGANRIEVTVFEGDDPLREGRLYRWDGTAIASIGDPMDIAVDEAGRPLAVTLDGHVLISGSTGTGKSKLVRLIIGRTLGASGVVRFGIDCKPGSVELRMFEPAMHLLAKTPLEAVRLHHALRALTEERGAILTEHDDDTWRLEYGPKILIASDERAVILRDYPKAAGLIEHNMQMIRFAGGVFIDATQTPSAGVYGNRTDARHQYDIRIAFGNEAVVGPMVFGPKAASEGWRLERLDAKGKLLIRTLEHRVPRPYKSLWAERAELQQLVATAGADDLDARSAAAFAAAWDAFDPAEYSPEPPRGGRRPAADAAPAETPAYTGGRPPLKVVRTFPDGSAMSEARALLWDAIGDLADGFTYADVLALGLDGVGSRSTLQAPLDVWRAKGWVVELGLRGNAKVFQRVVGDEQAVEQAV